MVGSKENVAEGHFSCPASVLTKPTPSLFTYTSPPRILQGNHGRTRKHRNKVPKPRGIHDYYNLMWDPHVRRGNTAGATKTANEPEEKPKTALSGRTKRSTMTTSTPRNVIFNSSKKKQVKVGTPPPLKNLFHSTVQTDVFLEDLSLADHVLEVDKVVQTDLLLEQPLPSFVVPVKTGVDASTQVLPGELIDFEEEVQPIVSTLVAKVLEQAFLETMEEEELAALKEQQNRFQEKMKEEQRQLRALQEQHERLTAEKERLEKNMKEQPQEAEELSIIAGGGAYSTIQVMELLPSVLNSLRQEGYIQDESSATATSPILALSLPNVGPDASGSTESSDTAEIPENQDTSEKLELGKEEAESPEEPWTALENLEKELTEESGKAELADTRKLSL